MNRNGSRAAVQVEGVLIHPAAAYAMTTVIDAEQVRRQLESRVPGPRGQRWIDLADEALWELRQAGEAWAASVREKNLHRPGNAELPHPETVGSSTSMTTREAAEHLGVSDRRIRQLIDTGKLPAERTADGRWRLDAEAVIERAGGITATKE